MSDIRNIPELIHGQLYKDPASLETDLSAKFELHGNGSINVVTQTPSLQNLIQNDQGSGAIVDQNVHSFSKFQLIDG